MCIRDRVSGTQSDIDTLSGTTLKGKIDVTGLGTGTHTVTVKPNYASIGPVYTTLSARASSSASVSYTHLDVYKRQTIQSSCREADISAAMLSRVRQQGR